jgi:hypothetical protein
VALKSVPLHSILSYCGCSSIDFLLYWPLCMYNKREVLITCFLQHLFPCVTGVSWCGQIFYWLWP